MRIFLIGFMACGKTHWGKLLGKKLQIPFFDLDRHVEEKEESTITKIFEEYGEEYFRLLEKDVLHLLTENHESFVMACGGGTPCFYNSIDYMNKNGQTIWINCSIDCLYERLNKEKDTRPLIMNMNEKQLRSFIIKKSSDRKIFYQQARISMPSENLTLDLLVDKVFHS